MEAFLAADDLLSEQYGKARATYVDVEKSLPKGAVPFAIRFGVTFSHLYEGNVDAALDSLRTYLAEYRAGGLDQQFPEVFIWNAMARINLENGRLEDAMKAYEKGYESIPGSNLDEVQKKTWLGRLHHGKARTLARMGKHEQAWAEVETIKKMIEDGGEAAKQYWPAYHYVAGYAKLEAGDFAKAARAPEAGGQERSLPDPAAGPRVREARAEGRRRRRRTRRSSTRSGRASSGRSPTRRRSGRCRRSSRRLAGPQGARGVASRGPFISYVP